jgi:iron (metal) dependent repressor, dtxR family
VVMSRSLEDYLKGIYLLKRRKQYSNKNLAEYLNISPASVSEMIKKLSNENYLILEGRNINLTKKGSDIAVNIIRKHRVWEVFLVEKLGYDKDEIHEEAEVLEHVTSDKLLQKLEKFLFYPKECPHGSPIFYDSDGFNEANIMKLSDTEERDEIIILSVEDNIELYDYLREMDVTIKENYNIIRKDPFNGPIYLKNSQKKVKIIAYDAAKLIEIYKKNTEENNEYEQ